ncbi:MAG TPA: class I SAM-dependent methyltransferase [Dokdonella sp.]|jgi:SAM-dependent methyltransferase|nr:class I SAM-dependent methyltransferase [Dokdonella sp.]
MKLVIRDIARQFLPHRPHYYYTRIKMATDPLYVGVGNALAGTTEPLLDLGCGIGLLAHALRAQGFAGDYRGVDIDAGKIDSARAASIRAGHASVRFDTVDLKSGFPHHRGSVALLDIIQFLPPRAQEALLEAAIGSLTPGAILVIRTGLARAGWRLRFTRGVDRIARLTRWMNVGPQRYPRREELEQRFAGHGLQATFRPLHGRMPFENWLVCVRREAIATGPAAAVSALTSD